MPDAQDTLIRMCNFARDYATRNMSPRALVDESGYRTFRSEIDVETIERHVVAHPGLVTEWMCYCDDPRTDMWVLRKDPRSGRFLVSRRKEKSYQFDEAAAACATYIKLTFDSIV